MNITKPFSLEDEEMDVLTVNVNSCQLIVCNDQVNTFDWVIATLIDVCGHTPELSSRLARLLRR